MNPATTRHHPAATTTTAANTTTAATTTTTNIATTNIATTIAKITTTTTAAAIARAAPPVCGGLVYQAQAGAAWVSFAQKHPAGGPAWDDLGRPGPWKHVKRGGVSRLVFELPAFAVADEAAGEDDDDAEPAGPGWSRRQACLAWALATRDGRAPRDWRPPGDDALAAWDRSGALTLRCAGTLCRVEVIRDDERLALRLPLTEALPADLPEQNLRWLRRLLREAQDDCRLVRLGITPAGAAVAEVDLTGAPEPLLQRLVRTAIDCLRWVLAGLAETIALLTDAGARPRALDLLPLPA